MKKRTIAAGVGLTTGLFLSTACNGEGQTHEAGKTPPTASVSQHAGATALSPSPEATKHSPYTPRVQRAAQRILELAERAPNRSEGSPLRTITFRRETTAGGTIAYAATTDPESNKPLGIAVQQADARANFVLNLRVMPDGTLSSYCTTEPDVDAAHGNRDTTVIEEEKVWHTGKTGKSSPDNSPQRAQAVLRNEINALERVIDNVTQHPGGVLPALPDICAPIH